jgi:hypothetical protein
MANLELTEHESLVKAWAHAGRFLYYFAELEEEMNNMIGHLIGANENIVAIVGANVDFSRKIKIIRSGILAQEESENWKNFASSVIDKIPKYNNDRMIVAHCRFNAGSEGGVQFRRIVADKTLKREDVNWTEGDLEQKCAAMRQITENLRQVRVKLMPIIGIAEQQVPSFPQQAEGTVVITGTAVQQTPPSAQQTEGIAGE